MYIKLLYINYLIYIQDYDTQVVYAVVMIARIVYRHRYSIYVLATGKPSFYMVGRF